MKSDKDLEEIASLKIDKEALENGNIDAGEGAVEEKEIEYTPVQQEAVDKGWTPKDDFQGDEEKWVDAGAYLINGELMDRISKQNKLLKNQGNAIDKFTKMQSSIEKRAFEKAKEVLLAEKAEAYEAGDGQAIVAIEEQIKVADRDIEAAGQTGDVVDHGANFSEYFSKQWMPKNDWYETNDVMEAYADKIGLAEYHKDPSVDPAEIMGIVDRKMKTKFPSQFENPKRQRAGAVGGSSGGKGSKGSANALISKLTATEKKVGNDMVKNGWFKDLGAYAEANELSNQSEQE